MKVPLCSVEEIPAEGVKSVEFFGREVLAVLVDGQPKAIVNVCMHLGGPLHMEGETLVCAWHKARWSYATGRQLEGPACPDAKLMTLPTRIEDGVLTYVYGESAESSAVHKGGVPV